MKLTITNKQLLLEGIYYCDTSCPTIRTGEYDIVFNHSTAFNCLMPEIKGTEALICWCKELCRREIDCNFCDSIRVGERLVDGQLSNFRHTFNQLYYKMRHSQSKVELTVKIE
jgi:hypothetical protein